MKKLSIILVLAVVLLWLYSFLTKNGSQSNIIAKIFNPLKSFFSFGGATPDTNSSWLSSWLQNTVGEIAPTIAGASNYLTFRPIDINAVGLRTDGYYNEVSVTETPSMFSGTTFSARLPVPSGNNHIYVEPIEDN